MEPEVKRKTDSRELSTERSGPKLTAVKDVASTLTERVIAFIDARMHIVEEKPAPHPMRKAG